MAGASVRARRSRIVPRYLVRFYAAIPAWKATGFALEGEPRLDVGDLVEIRNAGAYSMSFTRGSLSAMLRRFTRWMAQAALSLKRCLRHAEVRAWSSCITNKIEEEDVL